MNEHLGALKQQQDALQQTMPSCALSLPKTKEWLVAARREAETKGRG